MEDLQEWSEEARTIHRGHPLDRVADVSRSVPVPAQAMDASSEPTLCAPSVEYRRANARRRRTEALETAATVPRELSLPRGNARRTTTMDTIRQDSRPRQPVDVELSTILRASSAAHSDPHVLDELA